MALAPASRMGVRMVVMTMVVTVVVTMNVVQAAVRMNRMRVIGEREVHGKHQRLHEQTHRGERAGQSGQRDDSLHGRGRPPGLCAVSHA